MTCTICKRDHSKQEQVDQKAYIKRMLKRERDQLIKSTYCCDEEMTTVTDSLYQCDKCKTVKSL